MEWWWSSAVLRLKMRRLKPRLQGPAVGNRAYNYAKSASADSNSRYGVCGGRLCVLCRRDLNRRPKIGGSKSEKGKWGDDIENSIKHWETNRRGLWRSKNGRKKDFSQNARGWNGRGDFWSDDSAAARVGRPGIHAA